MLLAIKFVNILLKRPGRTENNSFSSGTKILVDMYVKWDFYGFL